MRALLTLALVLLTPSSAQAGTIAREGTELVYRSAPGQSDDVFFQDNVDTVDFSDHDVTRARVAARSPSATSSASSRASTGSGSSAAMATTSPRSSQAFP